MGKKGPLWWRESDWLLRGSSAANQILLRHSGPILSAMYHLTCTAQPRIHKLDFLFGPTQNESGVMSKCIFHDNLIEFLQYKFVS